MFRFVNKISENLGLSYPEKYLLRIQALKRLGENEISKVIQEILTTPQWVVGRSEKLLLADAMKEAVEEGRYLVEIEAPLLTFPRGSPTQWNGDIDHVDTITGMYFLFVGDKPYITYGDHLLKKFSGGPMIAPALKKALGPEYQVTLSVDAYKSPASRFVIVLPKTPIA